MGIVKEIPVILNTTSHEILYEGDRDQETRMIIWTLNFTVKGFIFGKSSTTGIIKTSITNILNDIGPDDVVTFNMSATGVGSYQAGEVVYQGYTAVSPTASGKVISWSNNILRLTNINGNFVSSQPVYGVNNNASYKFLSYQIQPQKYAQIISVTNPTDANGNVSYTYTNVIQETPNTTSVITSANFSGDLQSNIFGSDDLSNQLENPIDLLGS
jgi:hypothetical protein